MMDRRGFIVIVWACLLAGCASSTMRRDVLDQSVEAVLCFIDCPSYTPPITLRHPQTATTVACGPYPYAVSAGTAAVYRQERRQCVERYQQQGYVRVWQ
jgi:hypothetical protein